MNPKHLPLLLALAANLPAAATSTEPFPPSAGEGRGGVSLQTTETNSEPAAPPQTILNPNRKYSYPPKASYGVAPRHTTAYCLQRRALSETFGGWL